MKGALKKYVTLGIFFVGISAVLWNCQQEEIPVEENTGVHLTTVSLSEAQRLFSLYEKKRNDALIKSKASPASVLQIDPDWNTYTQIALPFTEALLSDVKATLNVPVHHEVSLVFIGMESHTIRAIQSVQAIEHDGDGTLREGYVYYHNFEGAYLRGYRVENGEVTKRLVPKAREQQASFFDLFAFFWDECDEAYNPNSEFCTNMLEEVIISSGGGGGGGPSYYFIVDYMTPDHEGGGDGGGNGDGGGGEDEGSKPLNEEQKKCATMGKVYNEKTKQCECPSGMTEDTNGTCVDPCEEIQDFIIDLQFSAKVDELEGNLGLPRETGYEQHSNGKYKPMKPINQEGTELKVSITPTTVGFTHTHPDFVYVIDDKTGKREKKYPIKMFSPQDLKAFLQIAKNGDGTNFGLSQAYAAVITSQGNYMLKYRGALSSVSTSMNNIGPRSMEALYRTYVEESKDKVFAFIRFMKDILEITEVEIYEFDSSTGEVKGKYIDENGNIQSINC